MKSIFLKSLSVIICFLLVIMPTQVHAEEPKGKVTSIVKGQKAPYSGVLLDSIAGAKMLVDKKYIKLEVELQIRKELAVELSSKNLAYDLLRAEHDVLRKFHLSSVKLKEEQIAQLQMALKDSSRDYSHWWMLGGVTIGILLSVAVFYASVQVTK